MATRNEFNWQEIEDTDALVVPSRRVLAIAVYTNPDDDIVIRQEVDEWAGERDDAVVIVPKGDLPRLIESLQAIQKGG